MIDRGPYIAGRKWDLTYQTALQLGTIDGRHGDGEGDRRAVTPAPQIAARAAALGGGALASLVPPRLRPQPGKTFGSRVLMMGSKGKDVRVLQQSLTTLGQTPPSTASSARPPSRA